MLQFFARRAIELFVATSLLLTAAVAEGVTPVPLVRDAVRSVDLQARRIDVRLAFLGEADGEG